MKKIVIIPAYNEQGSIVETIKDIKTNAPEFDYIVINDCSKDNTLKIMRSLAQQDANVHYVSFSRN